MSTQTVVHECSWQHYHNTQNVNNPNDHQWIDKQNIVSPYDGVLLSKEKELIPSYNWMNLENIMGFPGGSAGKESACNVEDLGSVPGLGKFPWRRERVFTPVFWPREFHGLSPWSHKESDMTKRLSHFIENIMLSERSQTQKAT